MTAFTTVMTTTSSVDDSIKLAFEKAFWLAIGQDQVMDQFVVKKTVEGAKSIQIPKYARLAAATTPLTETDDLNSVALSDSQVLFTPAEYGNVVTVTNLASIQTGGLVDFAAPQAVGENAAKTQDLLAIAALDASTNSYVIGGTAAGSVTAGQVASRTFLNYFYNKLARASVPMINGQYVCVMHDDTIADLRADTSPGSWVDVTKYSTPETALKNEVGMYMGFRIVRNNNATFADQAGAGTVDLYNSYFFGANALGKAISQDVRMVTTGPYDKLGRFTNVGWYGTFQYKILDQDCVWVGQSASSVGANAS